MAAVAVVAATAAMAAAVKAVVAVAAVAVVEYKEKVAVEVMALERVAEVAEVAVMETAAALKLSLAALLSARRLPVMLALTAAREQRPSAMLQLNWTATRQGAAARRTHTRGRPRALQVEPSTSAFLAENLSW